MYWSLEKMRAREHKKFPPEKSSRGFCGLTRKGGRRRPSSPSAVPRSCRFWPVVFGIAGPDGCFCNSVAFPAATSLAAWAGWGDDPLPTFAHHSSCKNNIMHFRNGFVNMRGFSLSLLPPFPDIQKKNLKGNVFYEKIHC